MEENEQSPVETENNEELILDVEEEAVEAPAEVPKKEYTTEQKLARVERQRARYMKELGLEDDKTAAIPQSESKRTPGELDETQLDYLDLKGITDNDEIEIIQKVMKNTGQTVRQALKDDYVQAKLEKLRAEKAVKDATPSSTKRGGNQTNDLNAAIARFEATGELPDNFELRTAVVNAKYDRVAANKPSWRR